MPDTCTIKIEQLAAGGDGLGHLTDGRVCFVPGTLPGELVRIELTQAKKNFTRGRVINWEETSPDRQEPGCPVHDTCGGCGWQHISNEAQPRLKHQVLVGQVHHRLRRNDIPVHDPVTATEATRYRQVAQAVTAGGELFDFYGAGVGHKKWPALRKGRPEFYKRSI